MSTLRMEAVVENVWQLPLVQNRDAQCLKRLQLYIPQKEDGTYLSVPIHGDCLSVERMVDSKRCRQSDWNPSDRLDFFEPVPQEFHHRGLMMQVLC